MNSKHVKQFGGFGDIVLMFVIYVILIFFALVILLPLINVLASSFSSPSAVISGRVGLWPVEFNVRGYQAVLSNTLITTGFRNSLFYSVGGTFMNLSLTLLVAYPLSREGLYGKKFFIGIYAVTMFIGGGMVPNYLLMRSLGLLDTWMVMVIPSGAAVGQVIIARTFMRTSIHGDLYGAAEVDGCSEFRIFFQIVLPLTKPMIAVFILMFAVGHWNSFFGGLMYLRSDSLFPLQLVLRRILVMNEIDVTKMDVTMFENAMERMHFADLIKYATIVVTMVPVMLLYPFIQKHFVKGIMIGSIKG